MMLTTRPREGPSIYDVHTEPGEGGGQAHVDGGRGVQSTQKIKPSSHAKKLASFLTRISSLDRKKVEIFLRYKLVI